MSAGTIEIREQIETIQHLYCNRVLSQQTRQVSLLGRKCTPQLMYTFLGFELKLSHKRITCPDMTTARYLMIFAELGMSRVALPYDPVRTARLLPELEKAFGRLKELMLEQGYSRPRHQLEVRKMYRKIREGLTRMDPQAQKP